MTKPQREWIEASNFCSIYDKIQHELNLTWEGRIFRDVLGVTAMLRPDISREDLKQLCQDLADVLTRACNIKEQENVVITVKHAVRDEVFNE